MTGVDAQTLESRRFQVEETCRPFRVMPIMIGHADKTTTYASAEQMFLAHVVHTLAPWCERIEQAIGIGLLDSDRDVGVYAKFNLNGLMRGAFKDRMEGYARALGAGGSPPWMEVNEIRALEEINPVDWGDGKPEPPQSQAAPSDVDDDPAPPKETE
jgi:HK97 family phage portal protein